MTQRRKLAEPGDRRIVQVIRRFKEQPDCPIRQQAFRDTIIRVERKADGAEKQHDAKWIALELRGMLSENNGAAEIICRCLTFSTAVQNAMWKVGNGIDTVEQEQEPQDGNVVKRLSARIASLEGDLERVQGRRDQEITAAERLAKADILKAILPILDDLERGLEQIGDADPSVRDGVEMVKKSFLTTLARQGVLPMGTKVGNPFDPEKHEALGCTNGPEDNVISAIIRKGYTFYGQVLRAAQVMVSKKN